MRILAPTGTAIQLNFNIFRASSIEFINNLIDKHNLAQDKVKLVFVVHPFGKKFMSLCLDLIMIAIKIVMEKRNYQQEKSVDIDEVIKACTNMKEVETKIVGSIKTEIELVKGKTLQMQELSKKIFPARIAPNSISDFVEKWHRHNNQRLIAITSQNDKISQIYHKTADVFDRAQRLLSPKPFEFINPSVEEVKNLVEFYENTAASNGNMIAPVKDGNLNFGWLISQLNIVLPAIINYVSNFTLDPSDSSRDELKILEKHAGELRKFETKRAEFEIKFMAEIPKLFAQLKKAWDERKHLEQEAKTSEEIAEECEARQMELENMKVLSSPRYYFDTTKECLNHVVVKKNRIALMSEDEENNLTLANESKYFGSGKKSFKPKQPSMNQSLKPMGPPKPRRRLDAMELLEGAMSSRPNMDASSRFSGTILKHSSTIKQKFSSTLLSPDLRQPAFDCSVISSIAQGSPMIDGIEALSPFYTNNRLQQGMHFFDDKLAVAPPVALDDSLKIMALEKSPKGKLSALIKTESCFSTTPRLLLNDDTMSESRSESTTITESVTQITVRRAQDDTLNGSDSFAMIKIPNDDDLFNTSDTVLKGTED